MQSPGAGMCLERWRHKKELQGEGRTAGGEAVRVGRAGSCRPQAKAGMRGCAEPLEVARGCVVAKDNPLTSLRMEAC